MSFYYILIVTITTPNDCSHFYFLSSTTLQMSFYYTLFVLLNTPNDCSTHSLCSAQYPKWLFTLFLFHTTHQCLLSLFLFYTTLHCLFHIFYFPPYWLKLQFLNDFSTLFCCFVHSISIVSNHYLHCLSQFIYITINLQLYINSYH